jgi:hypothetical protein
MMEDVVVYNNFKAHAGSPVRPLFTATWESNSQLFQIPMRCHFYMAGP